MRGYNCTPISVTVATVQLSSDLMIWCKGSLIMYGSKGEGRGYGPPPLKNHNDMFFLSNFPEKGPLTP